MLGLAGMVPTLKMGSRPQQKMLSSSLTLLHLSFRIRFCLWRKGCSKRKDAHSKFAKCQILVKQSKTQHDVESLENEIAQYVVILICFLFPSLQASKFVRSLHKCLSKKLYLVLRGQVFLQNAMYYHFFQIKEANNVKIDSDVFTIHQQINLKGFFYHHHLSTMKLLPTHTGWLHGKLGNVKYNSDDKAWLKKYTLQFLPPLLKDHSLFIKSRP